jgi:hypothetical protein
MACLRYGSRRRRIDAAHNDLNRVSAKTAAQQRRTLAGII